MIKWKKQPGPLIVSITWPTDEGQRLCIRDGIECRKITIRCCSKAGVEVRHYNNEFGLHVYSAEDWHFCKDPHEEVDGSYSEEEVVFNHNLWLDEYKLPGV